MRRSSFSKNIFLGRKVAKSLLRQNCETSGLLSCVPQSSSSLRPTRTSAARLSMCGRIPHQSAPLRNYLCFPINSHLPNLLPWLCSLLVKAASSFRSTKLKISKLWPPGQIWPVTCYCKLSCTGTESCLLIYMVVVVTETVGLAA